MSWKTSGKLFSGPPTSSNTNKLNERFRPNLGGLNAFQREQQLVHRYGGFEAPKEERRSEWDVLKENHRFIRDDEEPGDVSWEERLARAYESKLFKEFALIDLKHYKSRNLALRWRTAEEVIDGTGETTCASLRCKYYTPPVQRTGVWDDTPTPGPTASTSRGRRRMPALRSFELPFVYVEAGERKEALVKVRLCPRCTAKLTWKPGKEANIDDSDEEDEADRGVKEVRRSKGREEKGDRRRERHRDRRASSEEEGVEGGERRRERHADRARERDSESRYREKYRRGEERDQRVSGDTPSGSEGGRTHHHRRRSRSRSRSPRRR